VKDSSATLLLNSAGKVYRIVASLLDKSGDIAGKATETSASGAVTNKVTTTGTAAGTYAITSSTTIVRNGATATFADLVIGDEVKYSVNGTNLVYLDAFINVLKGYKVTNYIADASGATIVTTKDGVETTFAIGKDANGNLLLAQAAFTMGSTYDLTLNRDGKVKAVAATAATGPVTAKVKTIASKDQVASGSPAVYKYRFNFTDGTSIVLDDLGTLAAATRNGVVFGVAPAAVTATEAWNNAAANDLYWLGGGPAANTFTLDLFAPSVSGRVIHALGASTFSLENSAVPPVTLATFNTAFSTPVTVNGVAALNTGLTAQGTPGVATYIGTVTFGSASATTKPAATGFKVEEFVPLSVALPVKAITSDATAYTYTLDVGDGSTVNVVANVKADDAITNALIVKAGATIAAGDVKIGDKLLVAAPDLTGGIPYIKAAADTTAPKVNAAPAPTATWTVATNTLTVVFSTDEPIRKGYVWIGGVQKDAIFDNATDTWQLITTEFTTMPTTVTVAGTDYSGNVSNAVDVPVV